MNYWCKIWFVILAKTLLVKTVALERPRRLWCGQLSLRVEISWHMSQKSDQILQVNVIAPLLAYSTLRSVLNISLHTFRWWTWSPLVIVRLTNPCFEILWMPWKCSLFSSFSMQYIEHSLNSLGTTAHTTARQWLFRDIWIKMEA